MRKSRTIFCGTGLPRSGFIFLFRGMSAVSTAWPFSSASDSVTPHEKSTPPPFSASSTLNRFSSSFSTVTSSESMVRSVTTGPPKGSPARRSGGGSYGRHTAALASAEGRPPALLPSPSHSATWAGSPARKTATEPEVAPRSTVVVLSPPGG